MPRYEKKNLLQHYQWKLKICVRDQIQKYCKCEYHIQKRNIIYKNGMSKFVTAFAMKKHKKKNLHWVSQVKQENFQDKTEFVVKIMIGRCSSRVIYLPRKLLQVQDPLCSRVIYEIGGSFFPSVYASTHVYLSGHSVNI